MREPMRATRSEYVLMAESFCKAMGIENYSNVRGETTDNQYEVVLEEFEEFQQAYEDGTRAEFLEEAADLIITIHIMAEMMGADMDRAYWRKMHYNLSKNGTLNRQGKVIDDSKAEKPDFGDLL